MERGVLLSGIGGQGVQLAAQVLAEAAVLEGRDAQLFGSYGGMMRGGNTDATVVLADGRVTAPPTVADAWAAVVLHHDYADPVLARLRARGLVLLNRSVWEGEVDRDRFAVVDLPATELASEVGSPLASAMVMLGALVSLTGLVALPSLHVAARGAVPPYRTRHLDANARAIDAGAAAGAAAAPPGPVRAWSETVRSGSRL